MTAASPPAAMIVVAPDSFGQTLTAAQAASAIAAGIADVRSQVSVHERPLSDGGPGFISALAAGVPKARLISVPSIDPLGRPVTGEVLLSDAGAAYIESAHATGLHLLSEHERNPAIASSYGLGLLMRGAVEAGARTLYVGLGGSATNDGGAGMLAALGVVAYDAAGAAVGAGPLALLGAVKISGHAALRTASIVAATDVDSPLLGPHGATAMFGAQKGVSAQQQPQIEQALAHFAELLQRDRAASPDALGALPGAGAAGGIGAALFSLRAVRRSGFDVVATALDLDGLVKHADLVVTGEGRLDEQSVRGKVPTSVAAMAREHGVRCIAICGDVALGRRQLASYGIDAAYSLVEHAGRPKALAAAAQVLRDVSGSAVRSWVR